MILDLVIEAGNPAASERLLPMLERHIVFYGRAPRQAVADGSFAKAHGVRDMAFHKKGGLRIEDMVRSRWVYRKLRNSAPASRPTYRPGTRTWRGLDHFTTPERSIVPRCALWPAVVPEEASFERDVALGRS